MLRTSVSESLATGSLSTGRFHWLFAGNSGAARADGSA